MVPSRVVAGHRRRAERDAVGHPSRRALRETEVEKLRSDLREHDVSRLEVPVHHAVPVRFVESIRDLDASPESLRERQRTFLEPHGEAFALHVLHDEEVHTSLAADVVESADVGMIEARDRPGLAFESLAQSRVLGKV